MSIHDLPGPSVSRSALRRIAAAFWTTAAAILLARTIPWFHAAGMMGYVAGVCGVAIGVIKSRLVFIPLAVKNVERIQSLAPERERISVFAFQNGRSYILIAGMIALGILLRLSPLPRTLLAGIYLAIGTALLLAVPRYLRR